MPRELRQVGRIDRFWRPKRSGMIPRRALMNEGMLRLDDVYT